MVYFRAKSVLLAWFNYQCTEESFRIANALLLMGGMRQYLHAGVKIPWWVQFNSTYPKDLSLSQFNPLCFLFN